MVAEHYLSDFEILEKVCRYVNQDMKCWMDYTEQELKDMIKRFIYGFIFQIQSCENMLDKKFYQTMSIDDEDYEKLKDIDFSEMAELFSISSDKFFQELSKYKKKNPKLLSEIDDYLSLETIPELNSKQYLTKKLKHIEKLAIEFCKNMGFKYDYEMEIRLKDKEIIFFQTDGCTTQSRTYKLEDMYKYLTPKSSDEAIKEYFSIVLFEEIEEQINEWLEYFKDRFQDIKENKNIIFTKEELKVFNKFYKKYKNFDAHVYTLIANDVTPYTSIWE